MNDPNGCARVDGRYHVFFQYNPAAPLHDAICWGHMSSVDLVHWRQEPIALVPRPGELDQYGCWSGCVLDDRGLPTAAYSGVADPGVRSAVLLARSDRRMRTWRQGRKAVAPTPADPPISHARDPFVFELDGHRYAIQGAGHFELPGAACVLVYGCDDLESWTELGSLLSIDDPIAARVAPAHIWECPNLIRFGDRWVLIVSLWSAVPEGFVLGGVRYLVGELRIESAGPRFAPMHGGQVDRGACFYAPQVLCQGDRTLMWGWAREDGRTEEEVASAGWAGVLTFCRELSLTGGALVSTPADELRQLRRSALDVAPDAPFTARAFEVEVSADAVAASLWMVDGRGEQLVAELDFSPDLPEPGRVFVDGSIVETFAAGSPPLTSRAYPTAAGTWTMRLAAPGTVRAWTLDG